MTSMPFNEITVAAPEPDAMNPYAYGRLRSSLRSWPLLGAIDAWFSDKRSNISRPKLLFTVSIADAVLIAAAGLAAEAATGSGEAGLGMALLKVTLVALASVAVLRGNWSYAVHALRHTPGQVEKIVKSLFVVFSVIAGAGYMAGLELGTPNGLLLWLFLAVGALIGVRYALARVLGQLTQAGRLVRRTVIVGGGPEAEAVIAALEGQGAAEISILGIFDDRFDERSADSVGGYAKLGNFDQLAMFCRNAGVDLLIVTVPLTAEQRLMHILGRLFTLPVDVRISAQASKLRLNSRAYTRIGRVPMLAVLDRPLTDWDRVLKNIEDRVLGAVLLVLAAPVMALIALAVRLDSKGPILFKQRRFGFNNDLVEIYKFRSLYADQSDRNASTLVTKDDARVTRVGRFIRRTSLDELPQLFNVLKGEMSLVGPRPHATEAKAHTDLYQAVVNGYFARHRMKPGVTGWAQVNGWRGETDTREKIERRVECDLHYIDNWSVLFDLYILALTPFALFSRKNAY